MMDLNFEQITKNMEALTHMLGQGVITNDEYCNISERMGIVVKLTRDGNIKITNPTKE